jgi:phosphatidylserine/phosphatidylglycerophosphate/cardiolipin synthase-like enzyme
MSSSPGTAVTFLEQDRQKPEQVAALLAEFLSAARASLHIAIYDLRLSDALAAPVVEALRQRAAAGVEVRIAYDAGKPKADFCAAGIDPAPPGTKAFVSRLGDGIQSKPITGGDPRMPKLMHHKYVVRDGRTPAGAVWTGSANCTDDAWTLQENNLVRIDAPELCAYYEADFGELWQRGDIATTGVHDTGTVRVGAVPVHVAFAPGQGRAIEHDAAHRISAARRRLKVCSMLLTSGAILGALSDVLQRGRLAEYGGVYDRTQMEGVFRQWQGGPAEWKRAVFERVAAPLAGKRSTPYAPDSPHDFMHNKVLVCDDAVITGSYNLSHSAEENAENMLIIDDPELADRFAAYIDQLARRYAGSSQVRDGTSAAGKEKP